MIPKIIHYIWLGNGKLPKIAEKCFKSWQKYCPDYQIIRWDETNLDIDKYDYVREAYAEKKYAFASDVLRLEKLYEYGGIYLDIDVELLKPIDELLNQKCFSGFESGCLVNPGVIFGTESKNEDIKNILEIYSKRHFVENGRIDTTTICDTVTKYYVEKGLERKDETQQLPCIKIYSTKYFSPLDTITNKSNVTKETYSIHWYNASWYSPWQKFKKGLKKALNMVTFGLFGKLVYNRKNKKK